MTIPSNETLNVKIWSMNEKIDGVKEQNAKDHLEVKWLILELSTKFDCLPKKFVTRLEFKAVSAFIWLAAVSVGIIGFFIGK